MRRSLKPSTRVIICLLSKEEVKVRKRRLQPIPNFESSDLCDGRLPEHESRRETEYTQQKKINEDDEMGWAAKGDVQRNLVGI